MYWKIPHKSIVLFVLLLIGTSFGVSSLKRTLRRLVGLLSFRSKHFYGILLLICWCYNSFPPLFFSLDCITARPCLLLWPTLGKYNRNSFPRCCTCRKQVYIEFSRVWHLTRLRLREVRVYTDREQLNCQTFMSTDVPKAFRANAQSVLSVPLVLFTITNLTNCLLDWSYCFYLSC